MNQSIPQEQNATSNTLTEKDLHCIARILQGCIYKNNLLGYCEKYCQYTKECNAEVSQGHNIYFNTTVRKKLEKASGVYLGMLIDEQRIRRNIILVDAEEHSSQ